MVDPTDFYCEEDYERALEDAHSRPATESEARAEYARNAGSEHPSVAWILTPWDTWERNPCYRGPPVRHPEDY